MDESRRMRIVMVVPGGVDRSGRARVIPALLWLVERLARRHDVLVIALNPEEHYCEFDLLGAKVACLGRERAAIPEARIFGRLGQFRRALRGFGEPPDIFHAFSAGEVGVLAGLAGQLNRKPVVTSIFSGELVWLPEIGYGWQGNVRSRLAVRIALALSSAVSAGSRFAGAALRKRPWHWIPLGVDDRLFQAPPTRPDGPPWRLMHVGHLNPVKDQEVLLGAIQDLSRRQQVRLDWFGEDTQAGRLQGLCRRLSLDGLVHFHGFQPLDRMVPFYRQAHLLLQSSRHESQGVAVLEAAAAGVPTVGTAVGLLPELAPQAGVAVPVGDAGALAQAAFDLLADPQRRQAMGHAARTWARRHNADWTAGQFEALYRTCIDGR